MVVFDHCCQQRQNLNEVENLYFHHSIRHGHGGAQRPHYAVAMTACPGHPVPMLAEVSDQLVGPGPSPLSLPSEHGPITDGTPSSHSQACPSVPVPVPVSVSVTAALGSLTTPPTNHPPSAFDLSDPTILARLAQLQAQVQIPSQQAQAQAQTLSRQALTTTPTSTSASAPVPIAGSLPVPVPVPVPLPAPPPPPTPTVPHIHPPPPTNHPIAFPPLPSQSLITTPPPYPTSVAPSTSGTSQPSVPTTTSAPVPTTQAPPIAPTALTYDSFWSTHASSTGPTRALYRTHTGFTASATPAGNVAMLTPGGHAAVMTAEGVYVGGANSRSG